MTFHAHREHNLNKKPLTHYGPSQTVVAAPLKNKRAGTRSTRCVKRQRRRAIIEAQIAQLERGETVG